MVFLTESWFWRGTQSAIFYYISCTPWLDYKYKKRRRKDAEECRKDNEGFVVSNQPGVIVQPAPFETNETWAQEIIQGPGPPKRWLKDNAYFQHITKRKTSNKQRPRADTNLSTTSPARSDWTAANSSASTAAQTAATTPPQAIVKLHQVEPVRTDEDIFWPEHDGNGHEMSFLSLDGSTTVRSPWPGALTNPEAPARTKAVIASSQGSTSSRTSSSDSTTSSEARRALPRPSMERRLSTAMDGFKEAMRAALHPDQWNWIRYDRDDEILPNFRPKMKSMWENVKGNMNELSEDVATRLRQIDASDQPPETNMESWKRGTHPAVNELHPPIVSQLPYSREEAKWMLLPPASADVMMGRRRPDPFDDTERRALCVIGRQNEAQPSPRLVVASEKDVLEDELAETDNFWEAESLAHLQRPQRAFLARHQRGSSMPPPLLSYKSDEL